MPNCVIQSVQHALLLQLKSWLEKDGFQLALNKSGNQKLPAHRIQSGIVLIGNLQS